MVFGGEGTHAEQAVFRLQLHVDAGRDVVGHQRGNTDAEVDVGTVFYFLGYSFGDAVFVEHNFRDHEFDGLAGFRRF